MRICYAPSSEDPIQQSKSKEPHCASLIKSRHQTTSQSAAVPYYRSKLLKLWNFHHPGSREGRSTAHRPTAILFHIFLSPAFGHKQYRNKFPMCGSPMYIGCYGAGAHLCKHPVHVAFRSLGLCIINLNEPLTHVHYSPVSTGIISVARPTDEPDTIG